jgi:hypothetical protein
MWFKLIGNGSNPFFGYPKRTGQPWDKHEHDGKKARASRRAARSRERKKLVVGTRRRNLLRKISNYVILALAKDRIDPFSGSGRYAMRPRPRPIIWIHQDFEISTWNRL